MLDYEVLILDDKARPRAFVEMQDSDDGNAVCSAAFIANGRPFEVWRDLDCIHRPTGTVQPVEQPISRWKGTGSKVFDTCDQIGRS